MEAALSVYLENLATTLGSREQLAIAEFAEALLIIPKVCNYLGYIVGPLWCFEGGSFDAHVFSFDEVAVFSILPSKYFNLCCLVCVCVYICILK